VYFLEPLRIFETLIVESLWFTLNAGILVTQAISVVGFGVPKMDLELPGIDSRSRAFGSRLMKLTFRFSFLVILFEILMESA